MLKISELNFGFKDAENYRMKEYKDLFNSIFLQTKALDDLCKSSNFFLIGEKGTGKTAYAVYLANNSYKNNLANIKYIRETEYEKFLKLKNERHLVLSDYTSIWKVIIYLLFAQQITEKGTKINMSKFLRFKNLRKAIDAFYANAFSPEIVHAIQFAEESKMSAELLAHYAKVGGEKISGTTFTETRFQTNLLYIQKQFEKALQSLNLSNNQIIFIDGIDIRPTFVPYNDYLECIKGLANAVWSINTDFFSSIRNSQGRMRVVLLIRPDIFQSLELQNQNNKISDNSVLLDWQTTYPIYRKSALFGMADTLLKSQQKTDLELGEAWDYYFPYDSPNVISTQKHPSSFISFMRHSYYRPRDIITMLKVLQENFIELGSDPNRVFSEKDFNDPYFKRKIAEYLLGQVKDYLSFYYSSEDYESFLKFFEYLNGAHEFTYNEYLSAYSEFEQYLHNNSKDKTPHFETSDKFLQFLYDLNIICYFEDTCDESFMRWCFRERNYSNISPKVKTKSRYMIHYGIQKALNVGKRIY